MTCQDGWVTSWNQDFCCCCSATQLCPTLCNPTDCRTPGLLKFMATESVTPSNQLIFHHPLLLLPLIFPSIRVFSNELAVHIRWQNIGASASASVLPMNIQGWFLLGLIGLISLLSKGLWRVFSSTTVWKHQFFGSQPSLWSNSHICTWLLENHSFDYTDLCWKNNVSAF